MSEHEIYYGFKDSAYCFQKKMAAELVQEELNIEQPVIKRAEFTSYQYEVDQFDECAILPLFLFKFAAVMTFLQSITVVLDWNFFFTVIVAFLTLVIAYVFWRFLKWRVTRRIEKSRMKKIDRAIFTLLRQHTEIEVTTLDILSSRRKRRWNDGMYYGEAKLKVWNK